MEDFEQFDYAAQEFDEWTVRGIAKKNLERGWATPVSGDATRLASLTDAQRKDLRAKLGMNGEICPTCGGPLTPWEGTSDAQYCAMCYIVSVVITPEIQPWQLGLLRNSIFQPRTPIEERNTVENAPGNPIICKHCDRALQGPNNNVHAEGAYRGKMRCDPRDSNLPYGYNAAPWGAKCDPTCLGYGPILPG